MSQPADIGAPAMCEQLAISIHLYRNAMGTMTRHTYILYTRTLIVNILILYSTSCKSMLRKGTIFTPGFELRMYFLNPDCGLPGAENKVWIPQYSSLSKLKVNKTFLRHNIANMYSKQLKSLINL